MKLKALFFFRPLPESPAQTSRVVRQLSSSYLLIPSCILSSFVGPPPFTWEKKKIQQKTVWSGGDRATQKAATYSAGRALTDASAVSHRALLSSCCEDPAASRGAPPTSPWPQTSSGASSASLRSGDACCDSSQLIFCRDWETAKEVF